jgi:hypothetical protein
VLEVLKVLADKRLAAGTVQEEVLEAVHRTVREEVLEARRTGLDVARQVQCDVAEEAGSPAEDGHRIGRVEDLGEVRRSLLGTAGLVEGRSQVDRSLAAGVLLSCQSGACVPELISFADTHEEAGHSLVEELWAVD